MKRKMRVAGRIFFSLVLAWGSCALSAQQAVGLSAGQIREIDRIISSEMSRQNIAGLSAAVATEGMLRWMNGFGMADLENFVPAKAETVYRLASISKPITAVAVMQLVEQGKVNLDAEIQGYVPYFPKKRWPLTVRNLLRHQGGVRHYRSEAELNSTRHYRELREALQIFAGDPLVFEPGTRYLYSTYGYDLLGAAVEGASGMRFVNYIREKIFEPAGMRTIRPDNVYEIIPNRARGYRRTLGGLLQNCALADTSNKIPGGGLCSTVEDLIEFGIHLQGGTLLKKETLEQMFVAQKTRDGKLTPYGLGWQFEGHEGRRWIRHGGAQQGTRTELLMLPEKGLTVAVLANVEGVELRGLALRIAEIALR